jgi:hypothetical protein
MSTAVVTEDEICRAAIDELDVVDANVVPVAESFHEPGTRRPGEPTKWFALFVRRDGGEWEMLCRRRSMAELLSAVNRACPAST